MDTVNIISVEHMTEEEISAAWSIYEQSMIASLRSIPTEELLSGRALSAVQAVEPKIIFPGNTLFGEFTGKRKSFEADMERTLQLVDRKYTDQHEMLINTLIVRILKNDSSLTVEQVRNVLIAEDIHVGTPTDKVRSVLSAHFGL